MTTCIPVLDDPLVLPPELAGPVIAIGNFDGVHLGHQALLREALAVGEEIGAPALLLTFEPHPRAFFQPDKPLFRLSPPPIKAKWAAETGIKGVVNLTFDAAFAAQSAENFVVNLLVGRLNAAGVVTGHDFQFGKGRAGTSDYLVEMGKMHHFRTSLVKAVFSDGLPVSSSRIRTLLSEGDILAANRLLGREWTVRATVVHGDKRGRLLGYPTANLLLDQGTALRHGIYAVRAHVDGLLYEAVASFGTRPTFDNGAPKLEVHLFDFSGDIYGKEIDVSFAGFIRPELKFDGIEPLIRQMDEDSRTARSILARDRSTA